MGLSGIERLRKGGELESVNRKHQDYNLDLIVVETPRRDLEMYDALIDQLGLHIKKIQSLREDIKVVQNEILLASFRADQRVNQLKSLLIRLKDLF